MKKCVLIFSGGMDSTVLLAKLLSDKWAVSTLSFFYGSKHNSRENAAAKQLCIFYGVENRLIDLGFLNEILSSDLLSSGGDIPLGHYEDESMKKTVVPFRNGIMLSIAAGFAESMDAGSLYFGAHAGDHAIYPDCRPDFIESFSRAVSFGTYAKISLKAPFKSMSKRDIALLGKELHVPFSMTWTCYAGREKHCGRCGACTERREALMDFDTTEYE